MKKIGTTKPYIRYEKETETHSTYTAISIHPIQTKLKKKKGSEFRQSSLQSFGISSHTHQITHDFRRGPKSS